MDEEKENVIEDAPVDVDTQNLRKFEEEGE